MKDGRNKMREGGRLINGGGGAQIGRSKLQPPNPKRLVAGLSVQGEGGRRVTVGATRGRTRSNRKRPGR